MAISNTENLVQLTIPSGVSTSTSFDYPNRVNDVSDLVVQETTLTPRIADSINFNQTTDRFTLTGHNLLTGNIVQFNGTAITGFSADTDYYVIRIDANIFQLATSLANAVASPAVPVTTTGSSDVDVTTLIRAGEQPLIRTLELDVDYTATRAPVSGLITSVAIKPTSSALSAGKFVAGSTLTIYRETDFKQESNYEPNAIIPADTLESNLDKLTMMAQQLKDDVARSVRFSEAVTDPADVKIPFGAEQRAGKILSFDSAGEFSISQEIGIWRSAWQSGRSYAARDLVFNDTEGADDRYSIYIAKTAHTSDSSTAPLEAGTNWDKVLDASFFATQVGLAEVASSTASGASDVAQDWAIKTDGIVGGEDYSSKAYAIGGTGVTSTAGKGAAKEWAIGGGPTFDVDTMVDGTNYSAKYWATRGDVATVAGLDTEIQAVAAISSDVSTVSGISSDVTTVAADGTDIGTVATNIANVNSVAGVSSNVTTVATNIANVNTVAGVSANVTTVAGVSADVTSVAGVSTKVATVADNIANVNTVAAGIADVNRYADEYTISATEPTSPSEGDLWYDSTNNVLKVRTATAWAVIEAVPQPLATTDSPTFAGLDVTANSASEAVVITQTSTGDALRVTQSGTGNALVVEDSANPDYSAFTVTKDGIVYAGESISVNFDTSSPLSKGDRNSFIDFYSDNSGTRSLRIIRRDTGVTQIIHKGASALEITAEDAGDIKFYTDSTERMKISAAGDVTMQGSLGIDSITDLAGTGAPNFPNGLTADNMLEFIDSYSVTSTGASTSTTATWISTGLSITVPSATVTKYKAIYVAVSNSLAINKAILAFIKVRVLRTAPSSSILVSNSRIGNEGSSNYLNYSTLVIDESLGSGDHTYQVEFNIESTSYASSVNYLGRSGDLNMITVFGVL